jgi:hypothetical protein
MWDDRFNKLESIMTSKKHELFKKNH